VREAAADGPAQHAQDAIGAMRLVVGLGNPGPEYAGTRHNAGFWVVDELAARHGFSFAKRAYKADVAQGRIADEDVLLLKPQTFMNASGESVGRASRDLGVEPADVVVVYDDLDLPVGRIRVRGASGAGGHHGVESLIETLGSRDFPRVRVGIGRPSGGDMIDYVLATPTREEASLLGESVERAADAIETVLAEGVARAMSRFNGVPPA
jgi:PTH1 family peptidyl-tRNA hydrolase